MPALEFGQWLPDQSEIGAPPHAHIAKNVLPLLQGFGPLAGLAETTDALDGACLGLYGARDADQASRLFAGDATKLYQLGGLTWTDFSKVGGYGPALDSTRWRFATYGDRLLACNGIDPLQKLDMSSGASAFADLTGSPGAPEYVVSYGEFVVIAGGSLGAAIVKWSSLGNSEGWTAGVGQSDEQELPDGGRITGLVVVRSVLYILQEQCVRAMQFVGGDVIMRIDKVIDGAGCVEPNSVTQYGQRIFYLSEDGFCQFNGESEPVLIGNEKFDRWFLSDSTRVYWYRMSAAVDPRRKTVVWAYPSTSSGAGAPDTLLIYNYAIGQASFARVATQIVASAASLAISPDDLTDYVPDDHPEIGPDDPFWLGGALYLSAMTPNRKLASFNGPAMEATIETSLQPVYDGKRSAPSWVKPLADVVAASAAAGSRVRPGDATAWASAVAQQASGRCPQRGVNGFYHAARVVVPEGETWTYMRGVEFSPGRALGVR